MFFKALITRISFMFRPLHARGQCSTVWSFGLLSASLLSLDTAAGQFPDQSQERSADWPQLLGPDRNGRLPLADPLSPDDWPQQLEPAWQVGLGSGYGGPAVVDGRILTLHRLGNEEFLEATNLASGAHLWRTGWPASYLPSHSPDNGPRCVPTIANGRAVCYGASGDLACIDVSSGELLWHRPLRKETRADDGYFGAGSAPLVIGQTIVLCLGGQHAGIVGLDLDSGETLWSATDYDASYAAPIAVAGSDPPRALVVTRLRTLLLDPATGGVLSEIDFGSRGPTVNAATPIQLDEQRFLLTASYGVGMTIVAIEGDQLVEELSGSGLLSSQYNTPVQFDDTVIGIDGREDVGVARLIAFDWRQRQGIWEEPEFGTAHVLGLGPHALVVGLGGRLLLLDPAAGQFQPLAETRLPSGTYRALPAFAAGRLVLRSSDDDSGRSRLYAFDLP